MEKMIHPSSIENQGIVLFDAGRLSANEKKLMEQKIMEMISEGDDLGIPTPMKNIVDIYTALDGNNIYIQLIDNQRIRICKELKRLFEKSPELCVAIMNILADGDIIFRYIVRDGVSSIDYNQGGGPGRPIVNKQIQNTKEAANDILFSQAA